MTLRILWACCHTFAQRNPRLVRRCAVLPQEKPYPKQPADMPTYPSSHNAPRSSTGQGHHQHHHHNRGADPGGPGGVKHTWSEAAGGLLEARRQALGTGAGGRAGGGVGGGLDDRFGAAFGGGAGSSLLGGSGVQLVRQRY